MTPADYRRSITLPPDAFDRALPEEVGRAAAAMGYTARLSLRRIARDCGLKTMPGAVLYVNGRKVRLPAEDLTVFLPGESGEVEE